MTKLCDDPVQANRERDLWLKETRDGKYTGNCLLIPRGWCNEFTVANGFTGGPDFGPECEGGGDGDGPELYGYIPVRTDANSPIETLFIKVEDLRGYEETTEDEARRIHPALAEHLDMINRN